jgi:hypothetical protein
MAYSCWVVRSVRLEKHPNTERHTPLLCGSKIPYSHKYVNIFVFLFEFGMYLHGVSRDEIRFRCIDIYLFFRISTTALFLFHTKVNIGNSLTVIFASPVSDPTALLFTGQQVFFPQGLKWPERDHSFVPSTEIKNFGATLHSYLHVLVFRYAQGQLHISYFVSDNLETFIKIKSALVFVLFMLRLTTLSEEQNL